ncbi:hypothetical protein LAZ67_9001709 [Cordylochernes scorpioides]|uniref:Uncharacterized protein n=1 Tax=Cordylochernes scorpioides TaxID=51811 RepID=A0ABY6KV79_9ARAC|nr:hypothetical protein LAZ67_9001709 [Cordylochernes scorpioides]
MATMEVLSQSQLSMTNQQPITFKHDQLIANQQKARGRIFTNEKSRELMTMISDKKLKRSECLHPPGQVWAASLRRGQLHLPASSSRSDGALLAQHQQAHAQSCVLLQGFCGEHAGDLLPGQHLQTLGPDPGAQRRTHQCPADRSPSQHPSPPVPEKPQEDHDPPQPHQVSLCERLALVNNLLV